MLCVLRVKSKKLALRSLLETVSIKPYRIDKDVRGDPEVAFLHYDVAQTEASFSEGLQDIVSFLNENNKDILLLSSREDNELTLDIGTYIYENEFSKNLSFDAEFMGILVKHRILLTLSLYQTSRSDEEAGQA
ncbi:MAG: hypothetical protein EPN75_00300 [Beijerinckiaceae bacterium]|nr:MAG: hypothetical protein EPN75_00300 [Beijerinckiaceae bacterium]